MRGFPWLPSRPPMQVEPSLVASLEKALAGRPRQRDLAKSEVAEMMEGGGEMIGASTAELLDDDDEALDEVRAEKKDRRGGGG